MRTLSRRLAAIGGLALAVLMPLSLTVPAQAATVYQDSSVQIFDNPIPLQHFDEFTAIEATATWFTLPSPSTATATSDLGNAITVVPVFTAPRPMTVQFTASGHFTTPSWSVVSTSNLPSGVSVGITTGGLFTVTPPSGPVVATNNQDISVTVKVTDGGATAFETLTAKPIIVSGVINAIDVTAVTDNVTLAGSNDNTTGRVFFSPAPAGVTFTGANLPAGTGGRDGVTLTGNVLSATSTVPGVYNDIAVTATDAAGATAVDTFDVLVKGGSASSTLPHLYGGHAVAGSNASRENVFVVLGGQPACLHFTIVGPGDIDGHQGWVPGHLGLNEGVYGGLLAHHGYTVYYQPVTQNANGSPTGNSDCSGAPTTPISGTHWGYVYFISGR